MANKMCRAVGFLDEGRRLYSELCRSFSQSVCRNLKIFKNSDARFPDENVVEFDQRRYFNCFYPN